MTANNTNINTRLEMWAIYTTPLLIRKMKLQICTFDWHFLFSKNGQKKRLKSPKPTHTHTECLRFSMQNFELVLLYKETYTCKCESRGDWKQGNVGKLKEI